MTASASQAVPESDSNFKPYALVLPHLEILLVSAPKPLNPKPYTLGLSELQDVMLKQVVAAIVPQFAAIRGIPATGPQILRPHTLIPRP